MFRVWKCLKILICKSSPEGPQDLSIVVSVRKSSLSCRKFPLLWSLTHLCDPMHLSRQKSPTDSTDRDAPFVRVAKFAAFGPAPSTNPSPVRGKVSCRLVSGEQVCGFKLGTCMVLIGWVPKNAHVSTDTLGRVHRASVLRFHGVISC